MSFIEYYEKKITIPRMLSEDVSYNKSLTWFYEHTAITNKGSLCIGIMDPNLTVCKSYIDYNIIPFIKANMQTINEKKMVLLSKIVNDIQEHIFNVLKLKFDDRVVEKELKQDIIEEIKQQENNNNIAIVLTDIDYSFSYKYILENI